MNLLDLMVSIKVDDGDAPAILKKLQKLAHDAGEEFGGLPESTKPAADGFTILKGAAANLASQGFQKLISAVGQFVSDGVAYQSQMEQYATSFEVMTGSAEEAANITEQLKDIAASTPFEITSLADTTQLLMNYGLTADDALSKMTMLGDISQGSADKMQRIATAYGQMSSTGKVALEDVKQMIEAGFNPLLEISNTTGESMESLYERISNGTLSIDEITASMERSTAAGGKYFESMAKQSETFQGRMSTLKDTVNSAFGDIMAPLMQLIADDYLPDLTAWFEGFGKSASEGMKRAVDPFHTEGASVDELRAKLADYEQQMADLKASQSGKDLWDDAAYSEYERLRKGIQVYTAELAEAEAAEQAAAAAQSEVVTATENATTAVQDQTAALQTMADQYVATYTAAKEQVQGWFGMFEKADEIQAASLEDMAANIQSQINFNQQYQQSLETLATQGYGDLASQIQTLGTDGAQYAAALATALEQGNADEVAAIATLLSNLTGTQESLAETMTTTSGQFDELITHINEKLAEEYKVELTDNAADVAGNVNASLDTINTPKYIDVITRYSSEGGGGADPNSHNAQGLDYVPFDGYVSSMHKGERIMTAAENRAYTAGRTQQQAQAISVNTDVTLELDGAVLARQMYKHNQVVANDRGSSFVRG